MGFKSWIGRLTGSAGDAPAASGDGRARLEALQVELASDDSGERMAAIAELERLARDQPELHWPVMESIVSHVRERRPVGAAEAEPVPDDVAEILRALGRRAHVDSERLPLGLFQVDLRGADLTGSDLRRADFSRSFLQDADLVGSRLDGANFQEAYLDGAKMLAVQLTGATFLAADMARVDMEGAVLDGADLTEAVLDGANLANASLRGASFARASLEGTHLEGADLKDAVDLSDDQLEAALTDPRTVRP